MSAQIVQSSVVAREPTLKEHLSRIRSLVKQNARSAESCRAAANVRWDKVRKDKAEAAQLKAVQKLIRR